jgi:hypothetical protein
VYFAWAGCAATIAIIDETSTMRALRETPAIHPVAHSVAEGARGSYQ